MKSSPYYDLVGWRHLKSHVKVMILKGILSIEIFFG